MFGFTFGIEIEAEGLQPEELRHTLRRKGLLGAFSYLRFPGGEDFSFEIKRDGSIGIGSEIVTNIMREQQLPLVKRLIGLLRECGMKNGNRCGIHIHVGLPHHLTQSRRWDEGYKKFNELMFQNWNTALPRILRAYAPRRERYRYCKTHFGKQEMGHERYLAINTTQAHHPTAEFRFFDTHLDYRYTCRAVRLACGLTFLALNGKRLQEFGPGESIESVLKVEEERWKAQSQRRIA